MNIKYLLVCFGISGCLLSACHDDKETVEPERYGTSPSNKYLGSDTVSTGSHLDIAIGEKPEDVYAALQAKELGAIHVVSNFVTDIATLQNRLPLYNYMLFDEAKGTENGVQLTLENGRLKSIWLNSGRKLEQWPERSTRHQAIRTGDDAKVLYQKLERLSRDGSYRSRFERVMLLTKDPGTAYDQPMGASPQWYFSIRVSQNRWDVVQVHFKNGHVSHFLVSHYED